MIRVEGLAIRLGEFWLRDCTMAVPSGQYGIILGPTGAGKTVLLECIAGLHQPDAGRVILDDRDVTALRPEEREVAYVPQDYCLFPHLTVAENIAFGLRLRRWRKPAVAERVAELAEMLRITGLLARHPLTLSGGEKQRVALARALAVRPRVLLLDEPLAAVDERTRDRLCGELRELQQQLSATIIHVTHNFEEALSLGDQVAIFDDGRILQAGPVAEVFARPGGPSARADADGRFLAEFVGAGNLIPGEVDATGQFVSGKLAWPVTTDLRGPATLVVRPEELELTADDGLPAVVVQLRAGLHLNRVRLTAAGHHWQAVCRPGEARRLGLAVGATVRLRLPAERYHLLAGCVDSVSNSLSEQESDLPAT